MGLAKYRDIIERHHPTILYALLEDDYIWKLAEQFDASKVVDFLKLTPCYEVNSSRQLVSQYMEIGKVAHVEALQKPDLTLPTAACFFNLAESRVKDFLYFTRLTQRCGLLHRIGLLIGTQLDTF